MALRRDTSYPGRFSPASSQHPQGAFKNRTSPTAQDGSYMEEKWANDWSGFFEKLLTVASITPNNQVDTALNSQYYDALIQSIRTLWSSGAGWRKSPDGLIEQWGLVTFPNTGTGPVSAVVNFPIPFTTSVQTVNVFDGGFGMGNMFGATGYVLTGFVAHCNAPGEGGLYVARGY